MIAAQALVAASAAILLILGTLHLVYTFRGPLLTPRDPAVQAAMRQVPMVITRQTTMWKAWIGFNASHGMGAILFALVYGYLALAHAELLFRSPVLLLIGLAMLGAYVVVARLYWFSIPFRSTCVALVCYLAGVLLSRY